jgi:hypothetical protein
MKKATGELRRDPDIKHQDIKMSRSPSRFTQADIARAIKAVQQVGADMRIRVTEDNDIVIEPIKHDCKNCDKSVAPKGRIEL